MTGRLVPDSSLLELLLELLELWEPEGLPLDRYRDTGAAFILGGGLVPDTLSTLPPTSIHRLPPFPHSKQHTHLITITHATRTFLNGVNRLLG